MTEGKYILHGPRDCIVVPNMSLGHYLLQCLKHHGNKLGQLYPESNEKYTFSDILSRAICVLEELQTLGVKPGNVVAVVSRISSDFAPILLASLWIGAITAPINPAFDKNDMRTMLSLTQPTIVYYETTADATIKEVLPSLKFKPYLILINMPSKYIPTAPKSDFLPEELPPDFWDREATILCSSGTTGLSKGVILTHKALLSQIGVFHDENDFIRGDDVMLQFSPNFWISGFFFQLMCMVKGFKSILIPSVEVEMILKMVQDYKVTSIFMGPNVALEIAKCPSLPSYDLSSIRIVTCGGAAMNFETQNMVEKALKIKLCQWYGMTEVLLALGSGPNDCVNQGSCGKLQPNVMAKILDPVTGVPVGPNLSGELIVKGPGLTKGYYRNPEATAAIIDKDGWLHTGDVAYYDEDGCFYIVDRIKDLIKFKGHHVAPTEIESLLLQHPGVKDVAIIGIKHDTDQEHPLGVVVRQPGEEVSEEELINMVKGQLSEFKWLRAGVRFVDSLPKTATGKVQRQLLRNRIQSEQSQA